MFRNSLRLLTSVLRSNLTSYRNVTNSTSKMVTVLANAKWHNNNTMLTPVRRFSLKKIKTEHEIKEIVIRVCKEFDKIPTEKFTIESRFMEDFGLDSLDHVELIMAMEDEFEFEIPVEESEKLKTPNDIVGYVNNYFKNYSPITV